MRRSRPSEQARLLLGCRVRFRCKGQLVVGLLVSVTEPGIPGYRALSLIRGSSEAFLCVQVEEALGRSSYYRAEDIIGDIDRV